jgi:hypothetical protein
MSTTKCVCAVMRIEKERGLSRARAERVSREAAAADGFRRAGTTLNALSSLRSPEARTLVPVPASTSVAALFSRD